MTKSNESLRARFLDQGYLVVEDVVPAAACDAVIAAMCEFIGVDLQEPNSYRSFARHGHGIVPLHHHQALWDVRQLPQMHALFSALHGSEKLWVTHDRVSFKAPSALLGEPFRMDAVHWDADPRSTQLGIQGLVYLADTPAERGAFAMVPDLYRELDTWLQHADATELRRPNVAGRPLVPLSGRKGSVVLWHRRMPHTSLENRSDQPRLVQYVAMDLASDSPDARAALARACLEKRPPEWAIRQNVPGQLNPEPGPPVDLTDLGRRLTGIDAW